MKAAPLNILVEGSGPVLVLIHGVAGSLHIWDPIAPTLAQLHTVARMDLLGYGHSPKPRVAYTPQRHVEKIRESLQSAGLKPPYTLVGLSMGVNLALEFAARYPAEVGGFIGIGMPYYSDAAAAKTGLHNNLWTRLALENPGFARFFIPTAWWLGRYHLIPSHLFTKIYSPLMTHDTLLNKYHAFRSSLINCMVKLDQDALLKQSGGMQRLFLHGVLDTWAPPEAVRNAVAPYPKSRLETIEGAGHNLVVLKPDQTIAAISAYLSATNQTRA